MKKTYLLMASLLMAGGMAAQLQEGVGGEMTALLPEGVTANIDQTKMFQTAKNLTVAGSPEKGYYAFFSATDTDHGEELWVTDGTAEGTHMVMDMLGSAIMRRQITIPNASTGRTPRMLRARL